MIEPFPERNLPVLIHFRTAEFSDSRAPFVRQLVMGLRPYVHNHVITIGTDCVTNGIQLQFASTKQMKNHVWLDETCSSLEAAYPRILAVVGHFGNGARLGLSLAHRLGVPLIGIFGGSDVNVEVASPKYKEAYKRVFGYPLTQCVGVAPYLSEKLVSLGADPDRTRSWFRGTSLDEFQPAKKLPDDAFRIVIVGRFMEVKGHSTAIKGFAKAWQAFPRLRLVLLGDGELREELRALCKKLGISDAVEFRGQVTRREVIETLAQAEAQMLTSVTCKLGRTEGIPNAIVEGLACGLPGIGTIHGGIPEVISNDYNGFLVKEYDHEAIAEALGRLVSEPDLYKRLATNAREDALTRFDSKKQIREMAAFIYQQYHFRSLKGIRNQKPENLPIFSEATYSKPKMNAAPPRVTLASRLWIKFKRVYCRMLERVIVRPLRHANVIQGARTLAASSPAPQSSTQYQDVSIASWQTEFMSACAQCPQLGKKSVWTHASCSLDSHCISSLGWEFWNQNSLNSRSLGAALPGVPVVYLENIEDWIVTHQKDFVDGEYKQIRLVVTVKERGQILPVSMAVALFDLNTLDSKDINARMSQLLQKLTEKGFELNIQDEKEAWVTIPTDSFQARFSQTLASKKVDLSQIKDTQLLKVRLRKLALGRS